MQQEKKLNLLSIRRRYVLLLKTVVVTPLEISEGRGKMCQMKNSNYLQLKNDLSRIKSRGGLKTGYIFKISGGKMQGRK